MTETSPLPPQSTSSRFVPLLVTGITTVGTAFAATSLYLAWRVYHQMETLLSLNVFGMSGADPAALAQTLGRLAFGTFLVASLTMLLTLTLGFGYAYLMAWMQHRKSQSKRL